MNQLESLVATLQQEIERLKAGFVAASEQESTIMRHPDKPTIQAPSLPTPNVPFVDLHQVTDITGKRPSQFRLPDGTEIKVKRWKDILRESCKFALASNPNIPIPFPDRSGKKVSLFSNVKPAAGISYVTEDYNGQTIFIYVNYDANNCVANASYVLQQVPKQQVQTNAAVAIVQGNEST